MGKKSTKVIAGQTSTWGNNCGLMATVGRPLVRHLTASKSKKSLNLDSQPYQDFLASFGQSFGVEGLTWDHIKQLLKEYPNPIDQDIIFGYALRRYLYSTFIMQKADMAKTFFPNFQTAFNQQQSQNKLENEQHDFESAIIAYGLIKDSKPELNEWWNTTGFETYAATLSKHKEQKELTLEHLQWLRTYFSFSDELELDKNVFIKGNHWQAALPEKDAKQHNKSYSTEKKTKTPEFQSSVVEQANFDEAVTMLTEAIQTKLLDIGENKLKRIGIVSSHSEPNSDESEGDGAGASAINTPSNTPPPSPQKFTPSTSSSPSTQHTDDDQSSLEEESDSEDEDQEESRENKIKSVAKNVQLLQKTLELTEEFRKEEEARKKQEEEIERLKLEVEKLRSQQAAPQVQTEEPPKKLTLQISHTEPQAVVTSAIKTSPYKIQDVREHAERRYNKSDNDYDEKVEWDINFVKNRPELQVLRDIDEAPADYLKYTFDDWINHIIAFTPAIQTLVEANAEFEPFLFPQHISIIKAWIDTIWLLRDYLAISNLEKIRDDLEQMQLLIDLAKLQTEIAELSDIHKYVNGNKNQVTLHFQELLNQHKTIRSKLKTKDIENYYGQLEYQVRRMLTGVKILKTSGAKDLLLNNQSFFNENGKVPIHIADLELCQNTIDQFKKLRTLVFRTQHPTYYRGQHLQAVHPGHLGDNIGRLFEWLGIKITNWWRKKRGKPVKRDYYGVEHKKAETIIKNSYAKKFQSSIDSFNAYLRYHKEVPNFNHLTFLDSVSSEKKENVIELTLDHLKNHLKKRLDGKELELSHISVTSGTDTFYYITDKDNTFSATIKHSRKEGKNIVELVEYCPPSETNNTLPREIASLVKSIIRSHVNQDLNASKELHEKKEDIGELIHVSFSLSGDPNQYIYITDQNCRFSAMVKVTENNEMQLIGYQRPSNSGTSKHASVEHIVRQIALQSIPQWLREEIKELRISHSNYSPTFQITGRTKFETDFFIILEINEEKENHFVPKIIDCKAELPLQTEAQNQKTKPKEKNHRENYYSALQKLGYFSQHTKSIKDGTIPLNETNPQNSSKSSKS